MALQRVRYETAIPTTSFIMEAARADAIPILPEKKAALPLERRCLKIRLTDRECGQNSCRCAGSEATEEIKESRLSTKTQDTMKEWRTTAIGKEHRSPLAKCKPIKGVKVWKLIK